MASHENYYTSGTPNSNSASPISNTPPPPPPKPTYQSHPANTSRSNLPIYSSSTPISSAVTNGPPLPPHPNQNTNTPHHPNSPRPLPPVPPTPQIPGTQSPGLSSTTTSGTPRPDGHQFQNQYQQQPQQQRSQIPPPAFEDRWLPEGLASKQISELTPVLSNPQLLAALASQHPSHASSLEPLHDAVAANRALAKQVAQVEGQLSQLRDQVSQLMLNHTSLQTQWRRKQSEMDDALSPWGPRAMYQRLVSSISEQESILRAVQESFLEGGGHDDSFYGGSSGKASEKEVTEWVRRIREGTTTLEKRREMRARWDEGRVGGWR